MYFKAYSSKLNKLSHPFTWKDIQRGVYVEAGKYPYDLNKCDVIRDTGLTDLCGKHIWEGDIVEFPLYDVSELKENPEARPVDSFNDLVVFYAGSFILKNPAWRHALSNQTNIIKAKVEVIGNIFFNRDLLELNIENIKI